jgi:hypothetical protein
LTSAAAAGRCSHHNGTATGWLDTVDLLQVVHDFLGLEQRKADNTVTQFFCSCIERCCFRRHDKNLSLTVTGLSLSRKIHKTAARCLT